MSRRARTGVLVMAHGTPASPEEIEAFYTRIRRGRPPTPDLLAELQRRYETIGGISPLAARTAAQVEGIADHLEAMRPGGYLVRYGAKHTDPAIEAAAADLAAQDLGSVVGIVLTPHRASMGSDEYLDRAEAALTAAGGPTLVRVPQWYETAGFAPLVAERVRAAVERVKDAGTPAVLFTAHSLPQRVVADGDPYPQQVADSAAQVAAAAGLAAAGIPWSVAWQSAGRTPEPWIGPDLLAELRRLAAQGTHAAVVCPVGFVADHLEVLFDVDVEARQVADQVGLALARTESLNADPRFTALLAEVVDRAAGDSAPTAATAATAAAPNALGDGTGQKTVVVVGGGIAGLAAAWELTGGAAGPDPAGPCVVVLEADGRLGGKLQTTLFDGRPVDVGPDGFLGRRPEAAALCREVGLGPELEPIGASGAAVWTRGRRRPLPDGLFLGVPTRFRPVARSGILSPLGTARLLVDLVAPRPDRRGPLGDRAVGPLVTRKLGRQTVGRLVEPLLGGIYAGTLSDASAAAVFPPLLKVSQGRTSFMRAMGRLARSEPAAPGPPPLSSLTQTPGSGLAPGSGPAPLAAADGDDGNAATATSPDPAFWTLRNGLGSLVDRLGTVLRERGVTIRTECSATALAPCEAGWRVQTSAGAVAADGVVLAIPAQPAAELLAPLDADAAAMLQSVAYASVAVVTLSFPSGALPDNLYGTGLLVPRGTPLPPGSAAALGAPDGERCMVTACTYLSTKWPHLSVPGQLLVRASVGRFGDERFAELDDAALVDRVVGELAGLLGATARPEAVSVTRWRDALPQYRVQHLLRVGGVESATRRLGSLAVAGAAYRGVGIPACIGSGRAAARAVMDELATGSGAPGSTASPAGSSAPAGSPAGADAAQPGAS